jgi:ribosomal protein S18 acetylase RimI-like enzyme
MRQDHTNSIANVEPVCTDPDYRRMGLGTAVVLEGIRRCGAEGAAIATAGIGSTILYVDRFQEALRHQPLGQSVGNLSEG